MRVGIDLAKTKRWEALEKKHPQRVGTIFTEEELAHCRKKGLHAHESMAALWAVREAAGKALGIGFFRSGWQDAYVSWSEYGAPILHLKGNFKKRADELGITDMAVSITHEDGMAAAVVIMTGGTNEAAEQR